MQKYPWLSARWGIGQWFPLRWVERTFAQTRLAVAFRPLIVALDPAGTDQKYYQQLITGQALLCPEVGLIGAMPLLSCDCGS